MFSTPHSALRVPHSKLRALRVLRAKSAFRVPRSAFGRCRGFTLIEILTVIVLIAILLGITLTVGQKVLEVTRQRRAENAAQVLTSALHAYRTQYGDWPVPREYFDTSRIVNFALAATNYENAYIFDMLRTNSTLHHLGSGLSANTNHIRFLDETALFTLLPPPDGRRMTLHNARVESGAPLPIVFMRRNAGTGYYVVTINFDNDTATVTPDGPW